ncbi:hypothetical protein BJY01DRAFT_78668 [Aspergillus pseudoustus]|uniref:Uncharacterized protein n=1 Tax=Aspergillus pseudoustus TaxID=1810923 RepID=A0ABR4KPV6_9EURO
MSYQRRPRRVLNNPSMGPPPPKQPPTPPAGAVTASKIAKIIDEADIPYFLWGWLILTLHVTEIKVPEIEFVIPDDKLEAATNALVAAGYPQCESETCVELHIDRTAGTGEGGNEGGLELLHSEYRFHPVAGAHFHHFQDERKNVTELIALLPKNDIAPWLPELKVGSPAQEDPDFMLSTDPSLPKSRGGAWGPWTELHPVKIQNRASYTESFLWLSCRDIDRDNNLGMRWMAMWRRLLDVEMWVQMLREKWHPIWGDGMVSIVELLKVREKMIKDGELPKDLPKVVVEDYAGR